MKAFILFVLGIDFLHSGSAATHTLQYFYTGTSGIPNFPEFMTVGMVDGYQIDHYDSITKRAVQKAEWISGAVDPEYWNRNTQIYAGNEPGFKSGIDILKSRFNQTEGVHTWMRMYGCEWDETTGVTDGFNQYGYDGEDFVTFDTKTSTWIAPTPEAVITKHKWDNNKALIESWKNYYTQICIEWLKKYVDYGKNSLMRTVPPSVSLLQKTPSSPVTCHATGFYPSGVHVAWKKDGQDHHEDVEMGETLQNDDGTFQRSAHLTVKPEEWKNNKYQCVVQVSGINEDFIKVLTEEEIKTNMDPTSFGPIIGVVVAGLLVIVAAVIGVVIWKKKSKKGFVPANTSDDGSNSSNNTAPKA